jgi:plasmid stabilization system protein ParE
MKYVVLWPKGATNDLTEIWLDSADRQQVTDASDEIDRLLKRHPLRVGQPMESSVQRRLVLPPLGVHYEVIEDDKRVIVLAVFEIA